MRWWTGGSPSVAAGAASAPRRARRALLSRIRNAAGLMPRTLAAAPGVSPSAPTSSSASLARGLSRPRASITAWLERAASVAHLSPSPAEVRAVARAVARWVVPSGFLSFTSWMVALNASMEGFTGVSRVHPDNAVGVELAMRRLAELGHASAAFTQDRYGHLFEDADSEAAAAVAAMVDEAL